MVDTRRAVAWWPVWHVGPASGWSTGMAIAATRSISIDVKGDRGSVVSKAVSLREANRRASSPAEHPALAAQEEPQSIRARQ